MELDGYSRPTCSKQPRLVSWRIGVVSKLHRWWWYDDEFCWQHDRLAVAKFAKSWAWNKVQEGSTLNFLVAQCWTGGWKPPCQKPSWFFQSFQYNTGLWRMDRWTHDNSLYCSRVFLSCRLQKNPAVVCSPVHITLHYNSTPCGYRCCHLLVCFSYLHLSRDMPAWQGSSSTQLVVDVTSCRLWC